MSRDCKVFTYNSKDRHSIDPSSMACLQAFIVDELGDIYLLMFDYHAFRETYAPGSAHLIPDISSYRLYRNNINVLFSYFKRKRAVRDYLGYIEEHKIIDDMLDKGTYKKYAAKILRISSIIKDMGKKLAFVGFTVAVVAFIWVLLAGFGLILVPDTFMYILFGLFFVGVVSGSIGLDKALYKGSKLIKAKDLKWDNPSQSENAKEEIKIKQPVKIVNKTSPLEPVCDKNNNPIRKTLECMHCKEEFTYLLYGNFAVFCPHCKKYTYGMDERGFAAVTPYAISIGEEQVARVTYAGLNTPYILESEKYNLNIVLKSRYVDAIKEALEIVEEYI